MIKIIDDGFLILLNFPDILLYTCLTSFQAGHVGLQAGHVSLNGF